MNKNESTISDFNLEKIATPKLIEHVAASIAIGSNIAIFGRRGTGKTEICKQQIAESNCLEVYMNLSTFDRVDFAGYPDIMGVLSKTDTSKRPRKTKEMKELDILAEGVKTTSASSSDAIVLERFVNFLLPQFYKAMIYGNKDVVALLDEVDKADSSLWAPLLEFVQFKSINGRQLPRLRCVIMTGNLLSEGGQRPCLPLLDRTEKYLVEPDSHAWLRWAGLSGKIHPAIYSYIHENGKELYGEVDPDERYADPSPRGWTRASHIITEGEKRGWKKEILNQKVSGCVGKKSGMDYAHYYEHYQKVLPIINDLFLGEDVTAQYNKLEQTKKLIACIFAGQKLANQMDLVKSLKEGTLVETKEEIQMRGQRGYQEYNEAKETEKLDNYLKHSGRFFKNVDDEMTLVVLRNQITLDRIIDYKMDDLPNWDNMIKNMGQMIDAKF